MKGKHVFGALLGLVLILALVYLYGGSQAPPGQPPLESVTAQNVVDVKNQFNSAKEDVRILLLLSPT
jgi:hypothetical protein